ncbi:MAG: hypothetical protein LBE16_05695, partial [Clostridiales Family XIII bacterium]|nr:hypothetical protein [Clostridiales Family XIII bacterium]
MKNVRTSHSEEKKAAAASGMLMLILFCILSLLMIVGIVGFLRGFAFYVYQFAEVVALVLLFIGLFVLMP